MTKISFSVAAVQAVLVALVLLDVVELSGEQVAGIVSATTAVLTAAWAWFSPSIPVGDAPKP